MQTWMLRAEQVSPGSQYDQERVKGPFRMWYVELFSRRFNIGQKVAL